jgi:hypothetical protein
MAAGSWFLVTLFLMIMSGFYHCDHVLNLIAVTCARLAQAYIAAVASVSVRISFCLVLLLLGSRANSLACVRACVRATHWACVRARACDALGVRARARACLWRSGRACVRACDALGVRECARACDAPGLRACARAYVRVTHWECVRA